MPRLARKSLQSSFLHIIVQGINRSYIFQEDSLKSAYKALLKKNLTNTNINIIAYSIMNNHAHILLYAENYKELSTFMHKTNTAYAKLYNKIKNRVGYVFRDRYYVQMILNEQHLYNCISYIHNNPVNASIVSYPSDYAYSSYNEYIIKPDVISNQSISLVFGSDKIYLDTFIEIHKNTAIEDIKDVIDEYIPPKTIIDNFLQKYNSIEQIKSDEKILSELLFLLRYKCRIVIA